MNYFIHLIYNKLKNFWNKKNNCIEVFPSSLPKGAGTLDMYFFLGSILFKKYNIFSISETIRHNDSLGFYNHNRLLFHHQFEVILKPSPLNAIKLFKKSISFLINNRNIKKYHIDFLEDNWSHEMLGAYGVGYECRINGLEIAQITYFTKIGNIKLKQPVLEFAYGLERIGYLYYQQKKNKNIEINNEYKENIKNTIFLLNLREKNYYNYIVKNYNNYQLINDEFKKIKKLLNTTKKLIQNNLFLIAYEKILLISDKYNKINSIKLLNQIDKKKIILEVQNLIKNIIIKIKENKND